MGLGFKNFIRNQSGETVIEYIMLGVILAVVAVSIFAR